MANKQVGGCGVTQIIPESSLGSFYRVVSPPSTSGSAPLLGVMGTRDGTDVTIRFKPLQKVSIDYNSKTYSSAGESDLKIKINQFETFSILSTVSLLFTNFTLV